MNGRQTLREYHQQYLSWMKVMNYSPATIDTRNVLLGYFVEWAEERGLVHPREITPAVLERYRHALAKSGRRGRKIKIRTQLTRLVVLREFFKYLRKEKIILINPAEELELPRTGSPLPSAVLSVKEVERILQVIDIDTPAGIRDRAILEVFYSCGIRRKELCDLKTEDIDLDRELVMIRHGKGDKDRLIPIGERAALWVEKYLEEGREHFVNGSYEDALFLTGKGPLKPSYLTVLGRRYLIKSGLDKRGACHVYRHTMATLMLEGGADIRHVQEMLGHSSLESTQIYTRVAVKHLKDVHTATHPGARLMRSSVNGQGRELIG